MLVDANSDFYMEMFLEFEAVRQKFKEFITDEKLPLHVRVEAFMNQPEGLLPSGQTESSFPKEIDSVICKILGKDPEEDEVSMYDDFYIDRYAKVSYSDVLYRMVDTILEDDEELASKHDLETAKLIEMHPLLSELAEAILAEGDAGFTYDW
ncbi:tail length tape measure protein [Vibrio phage phi 3]|uniref:Uncharacterized protein n=1 Tax=Vibrio phage phi 3 TaxID=1589298 RepID=A0A0B5H2S6_9CAUD|nr:tail length tape measure protein [Vibrio phage phi 3]AJF40787.1 hypothetical protein SBVP3_0019 [Vibrio phage phi 3]